MNGSNKTIFSYTHHLRANIWTNEFLHSVCECIQLHSFVTALFMCGVDQCHSIWLQQQHTQIYSHMANIYIYAHTMVQYIPILNFIQNLSSCLLLNSFNMFSSFKILCAQTRYDADFIRFMQNNRIVYIGCGCVCVCVFCFVHFLNCIAISVIAIFLLFFRFNNFLFAAKVKLCFLDSVSPRIYLNWFIVHKIHILD